MAVVAGVMGRARVTVRAAQGVGGTGAGAGGVAIRVGSQSSSVAAVRHWTPIEAILLTEGDPKAPVAAGVVQPVGRHRVPVEGVSADDARDARGAPRSATQAGTNRDRGGGKDGRGVRPIVGAFIGGVASLGEAAAERLHESRTRDGGVDEAQAAVDSPP